MDTPQHNVSGWTEPQLLEAVKAHIGGGDFYIDAEEHKHIAAVVDFDGPDGMVAVDDLFLATGQEKTQTGKWLYITPRVFVMGEFPCVRWIHKTQ
ncbi:hypothetical protein QBC40DRAFT_285899 [Triangularia verruculosa]|uniref:Uncharacterized protein n=1 Tax=Triangularia verruculosa TaxID=2587418 RepID=A0AAN7ASS6_9PEZI|nr:hypothetical protein QBC40DRAFT_285899 [Triangularia verruculosa]